MRNRFAQPERDRRMKVVRGAIVVAMAALLVRAIDLNVIKREFLQDQGDARYLRTVSISAHRGMITDRNGEPLAVSTPVDSVWANPKLLVDQHDRFDELAKALEMPPAALAELIDKRADKEFVYLRRHVNPDLSATALALKLPGVAVQREYRRYYPTGEVFAHVLGFTNIDDVGQEGLELAYDDTLRGIPGSKRVIKDRLGRVVQNVESIAEPRPGATLRLSLDRRVQYLAYRELKAAVQAHKAKAATAVVLDVATGEIIAMVNQPSFNPNNREDLKSDRYRNRAVTDLFEPGSTMKPFTVAAALESGRFQPDTPIDTRPGTLKVGSNTVKDVHNYGAIDVARVIQKSSNVGAAMMALSLPDNGLWQLLRRVGFGNPSGSNFPGERSGYVVKPKRDIEIATLSFGYGVSVTALQLAQTYTVLAGDGAVRPVSFLSRSGPPAGVQALNPQVVKQVRQMMELVTQAGGTGTRAAVQGYRVAGKTGTVRKLSGGSYSDDAYLALFAGMAPASRPRLVMVVIVDEPRDGEYYGGQIAAPVFGHVMAGALRLLDIPPDDLPGYGRQMTAVVGEEGL